MDDKKKKIIIEGVKAAGNKIMELFNKNNKIFISKASPLNYGIPADKESEKIILDAIRETGLECEIISEESGISENKGADYKVYLDPLDGSVNFSRGIPVFCIGVGIFYKNEPFFGIIYDPNNDELFIAEKGRGVSLNGKKIMPKTYEDIVLVNLEWVGAELYDVIIPKLKKANIRARTAGSGVLALCYGVVGRGDGAILVDNHLWDAAPGLVFAKELGCVARELDGSEVNLNKERINIIVAPEKIFEKIRSAIK